MRTDTVNLKEFKRLSRNPKDHDIGLILRSIERFGYVEPIVVNETTGRILSGHGRVDALQARKADGQAPPGNMERTGDDWMVPVVYVEIAEGDEEAASIALNRSNELGGWDEGRLVEVLSDLASQGESALVGVGYDTNDIDELLKSAANGAGVQGGDDPGPQIDKAEELKAKWGTARGQLWKIPSATVKGKYHRLLCGDATDEGDVDRLMGGESPLIMVSDPPYGDSYDANWRNEAAKAGYIFYADRRVGKVTNDEHVDWREAWGLSPSDVFYCWHADRHTSEVQVGIEASGFEIRCQIIWLKPHSPISRGHYRWQHEPCWYAVRKGKKARWCGGHNETTVWNIALDQNVVGGHSTQKPLECMAHPIRNHEGDVYDPFLGSGTTMVAAEQLGRLCYGMDISSKYVAVTLERLSDMGLVPETVGE